MFDIDIFTAIESGLNRLRAGPVLREHVDLLLSQVAILKEELLKSKESRDLALSRVTELEAENQKLRSQIPNQKPATQPDEEATRILALLFRADCFVRITEITDSVSIPQHIVSGILSGLIGRSFVTCDHLQMSMPVAGSVDGYRITSEGKAFMMKEHRDKV